MEGKQRQCVNNQGKRDAVKSVHHPKERKKDKANRPSPEAAVRCIMRRRLSAGGSADIIHRSTLDGTHPPGSIQRDEQFCRQP